jgi:hypothetical protein
LSLYSATPTLISSSFSACSARASFTCRFLPSCEHPHLPPPSCLLVVEGLGLNTSLRHRVLGQDCFIGTPPSEATQSCWSMLKLLYE